MGYLNQKKVMSVEVKNMKQDGLLDRLGGSLGERLPDGNILMTPTTASFRRWEIDKDELVVLSPEGELVEGGAYKAAAAAPLFIDLFNKFPTVGAIAHSHCLYSLVFAAHGISIPTVTNGAEILGDIPCIIPKESDSEIKEKALLDENPSIVPSGFVQRHDVMAVNARLGPLVYENFKSRACELERHGLAFTLYKHGLFVMARHLKEATENIQRIETSAKVSILGMQAKLDNAG